MILLKTKIPIDLKEKKADYNVEMMRKAFGKNVLQKENEKIVKSTQNEFEKVGLKILYETKFNGAITLSGIIRCLRNLRFFSYSILKMINESQEDFEKVKENYIQNHH